MIESHRHLSRCRILMIGNNKGGVAKTTSTRLLADYLARTGLRVLTIDLDPQCNLSCRLLSTMERETGTDTGWVPPVHPLFEDPEVRAAEPDWDGRASSADIFTGGTYIYQSDLFEGIDLVPGHSANLELIVQRTSPAEMESRILGILDQWLQDPHIQSTYDVCLIDTPPSRNPIVMAALSAATDILIVSDLSKDSILGVNTLMSSITVQNWSQERQAHKLNIVGIALTKFDRRQDDMVSYHQALKDHEIMGPLLIDPPLYFHKHIRVADDIDSELRSVFDLRPSSTPYRTVDSFCRTITQRLLGDEAPLAPGPTNAHAELEPA